jgi:hypothetical protein
MALALNGLASTAGVIVDTTAPTASGVVRADSSPTAAGSARYTVSFSEGVTGLDASDFTLTTTGNASGSIASVTAIDVHTYTVLVTGLQGTGELGLNLNGAGTGLVDAAGNAVASGLTGERYELRPTVVVQPVAPPPVPEPPAPPTVPAPAPPLPPVTLAPTEPISPISTPTLSVGSPPSVALVVAAPGGADAPPAPAVAAPPPAAAPGRSGYVEIGASSSAGLQALPDIGAFSVPAGQPVSVMLPAATFTHSERNTQVSVEVRQADGRPLPGWLKFDPVTGSLTGQAPPGLNLKLSIEVIARDSKGNRATSHLNIEVKAGTPAPEAPAPKARPTSGAMLFDPGSLDAELASALAQPPGAEAGRASLASQFDRFGTGARQAERDALLEHARSAAISES